MTQSDLHESNRHVSHTFESHRKLKTPFDTWNSCLLISKYYNNLKLKSRTLRVQHTQYANQQQSTADTNIRL